jgi:D-galactarolactone cycloisomerase
MTTTLTALRAIPLTATFAEIYGGDDRIPDEIRRPASHFQSIPRIGQYTTLVLAESSDGAVGIGECFGLPTPHAATEMVNRVIAPALTGAALSEPPAMLANLYRYFFALGHTKGPGMEAMSGVDIALWDLNARRAGKPLANYLGAKVRTVPTYVSPVPFLPTPELSAAAAASLVEGFGALKLKVGRSAREDIPFIAAVREAIGPKRQLMLDANCGYNLEEAALLVREIRDLDITWLEEPLPPDDVKDLRRLSDLSEIPLAGGENEFTPQAIANLIDEANTAIVQPNISRAGGVTGLLAIDEIARTRGASVAPHGVGAGVVLSATLHTAAAMQAFQCFEINRLPNPLRDDLFAGPDLDQSGNALPAEGNGHGVAFDAAAIHRFSDVA